MTVNPVSQPAVATDTTALYWCEFDAALRPMLGLAVVLAAVAAALLTLSGSARRTMPQLPSSQACPAACAAPFLPIPKDLT